MNNLKRVLSLGLTGAMLAGLLTMGASAADFTDAEQIQHDEAVNVLVALKVIDGKPDGSFDPEGNVTRAEMAKMIAVAMNGGSDTNTGTKLTPSFTDIGGHWAESYIEYCADLGIISGRGDGTFDPGANVTGMEAAKMVLSALGFEATAYKLTGASWSVRTDEVARTQTGLKKNPNDADEKWDDPKLYDELEGVTLATPATRDTAAQLIWNALQNHTRIVTPDRNTNTGEVTWTYQVGAQTLLKERYDANAEKGVFVGNKLSGAPQAQNDGEISVEPLKGGANWAFPCDFDIDQIGEEVKVVWRDNKDGKAGAPDKRDNIYGVFNTGKTEVYRITLNDLQDAKSDASKKIKFGDTKYDAASTIETVFNYNKDTGVQEIAVSDFSKAPYKLQSVDEIKFVVCDNVDDSRDGKIYRAYITNYNITKVTSVSSSKITLQGIGSIDIEDNNIYEGAAVDDVVVYTKFYDDDKDDAFFTVTKAESVEGLLTGFKYEDGVYKNVVVDGETVKVDRPASQLTPNLTKDYVAQLSDSVVSGGRSGKAAIGDTVRIYKIDSKLASMVGCVDLVEGEGGKYAVVTEVDGDSVDSKMNPLRVSIVMGDGSEQTLLVHKDSTYDGAVKFKDYGGDQTALFTLVKDKNPTSGYEQGNLIEFSTIANGTIKIKNIATSANSADGGCNTITDGNVWDEDSRRMQYTSGTYAVGAADAVMFVGLDNKNKTSDGKVDNWYTYDMRSMGDIPATYKVNGTEKNVTLQYFINDKGLIEVACAFLNAKPGSSADDTLYGIVTGYTGTRQNADGDDLWVYTVAVGREKDITVAVDSEPNAVKKGQLVMFDERADGEYDLGSDIVVIVGDESGMGGTNDDTVAKSGEGKCAGMDANTGFVLAAVREYNAAKGVISYYTKTSRTSSTDIFEGVSGSMSVDKDVALYYVDADDPAQGPDTGVTLYDTATGYANAILHYNDKGVVDAIIVETSGDANLGQVAGGAAETAKHEWTNNFGKINEIAISAGSAPTSKVNATYDVPAVTYEDGKEVGDTFTVAVNCTKAPDSAETIQVTYNGVTKEMSFTTTGTQKVTFTIAVDSNSDAVTSVTVAAK